MWKILLSCFFVAICFCLINAFFFSLLFYFIHDCRLVFNFKESLGYFSKQKLSQKMWNILFSCFFVVICFNFLNIFQFFLKQSYFLFCHFFCNKNSFFFSNNFYYFVRRKYHIFFYFFEKISFKHLLQILILGKFYFLMCNIIV